METPTVFEGLRARLGGLPRLLWALSWLGACAVSEADVGRDETPGSSGSGGAAASGGASEPKGSVGGKGGGSGGAPTTGGSGTGSALGAGSSGGAGGALGSGGAASGTGGASSGGTTGSAGAAPSDAGSNSDAGSDSSSGSDPKSLIQIVCGPCPSGFQQMNGLIDAPKNDVCQKGAACGYSYQNMCVKGGQQAVFGCAPPLTPPWLHVVDVPNCDGYCPNGFYEVWVLP